MSEKTGKTNAFRMAWEKKYRLLITYISLAIIVASVCILFSRTALLANLELLTLDFLFQVRTSSLSPSPATKKIVIIEITYPDIQKIGRWPWPRTWLANLVVDLKHLGAEQIFLDLLASEPSTPKDDEELGRAIQYAGNVYMPFAYTSSAGYQQTLHPIEMIRPYLKGTGGVNLVTDRDGKIRRVPIYYDRDGRVDKNIVLQIAEDHLQINLKEIKPAYIKLVNPQKEMTIPLLDGNQLLVNWQGKWRDTFVHYSFLDVWETVHPTEKDSRKVDLTPIQNNLCIVAVTSLGMYDTRPNSLEAEYPGAGILATALSNIFDQNFFKLVPRWLNILIVYLFALIPPFYIFSEKSYREFFMIVFIAVAVLLTYFLFINNIVMNFILPFVALIGSYVTVTAYHFARVTLEKKSLVALATTDGLTGLFNIRYFREILKNACWEAQKGGGQIFYLILCDVDYFKQLNDRFGHQAGDYVIENVSKALKNSVRSGDVVARYGGDEMILLIKTGSFQSTCAIAEKIRTQIEHLDLRWGDVKLPVTVSLGVSSFEAGKDDEASVIKKADNALYLAKANGRNRIAVV